MSCLYACTSPNPLEEKTGLPFPVVSESKIFTDTQTKNVVSEIITNYFSLKDALVKSNPSQTSEFARGIVTKISEQDLTVLPEAQQIVLKKIFAHIASITKEIAETSDISRQRILFQSLSYQMYELSKIAQLDNTVYCQYCPMAFNDKGAYWLSNNSKIFNPYFGDEMLQCGEVIEKIGE
jgi:hypothetical protein